MPDAVTVLGFPEPGRAALHAEDPEPLRDGTVRVAVDWSGLSAGTELTWFRGTNPYLTARWDAEYGVFRDGEPAQGYPVRRSGYMETGRVVETRAADLQEGARVALACGHRTEAVADPAAQVVRPLPDGLDPLLGIWIAHMGPICANGLLHAAADAGGDGLGDGVRGRAVLVVGAGVVGLLTAAFAAQHGAEVVVADATPARRAAAAALGFAAVDDDGDAWRRVKDRWRHGLGDRGADVVFQCRGTDAALAGALRSLRPQGTVVDLAFYTGGALDLRLGEEFHHNGLALRCAQIGRVPRELRGSWSRARLVDATVDLLAARGPALRDALVTDVVPLVEAPALLADLSARRRHTLQAVFDLR